MNSLLAKPRLVIASLFAVFVALALARCWTNLPWCDEGWFFDPVYNWLVHGSTGTPVMVGKGFPWEGVELHQYWQPPLHLIVDAIWLKIFGLSLVAFRSLSTFAGIFLLISWSFLLRYFEVPLAVRLLALTFIATDYAVVRAASDGRTDMLAASFGLGAVALYLRFRESNFTLAVLLSQILVVCGGLTHPIGGVVYLVLLTYFFCTRRDWTKVKPFHIALALLPYVIGAICWGIYIEKDPQLFRKIFLGSSASGRLGGMRNPFVAIRREIQFRYLTPFGLYGQGWVLKTKLLIPLIYLTSAAFVWAIPGVRRQRYLRPFLAIWTICIVMVFLVDNQRNGTYMVHLLPSYAVLLASLLYWIYHRTNTMRPLLVLFAACFIALQAGGSLYIIFTDPYKHQYQAVTNYVLEHAHPGDRIVGTSELGFGIGFDRLRDDEALGYYVGKKPDIIILNPRYEDYFRGVQGTPVYDFVQRRLEDFQPVYGTPSFEVYLPKSSSIASK